MHATHMLCMCACMCVRTHASANDPRVLYRDLTMISPTMSSKKIT